MAETTNKTYSRRMNPLLKPNNDTGFGTNAANYGGRFINRDGTFNTRREGISFLNRFSIYHRMLSMSRLKFVGVLVLAYFLINVIYSFVYMLVGMEGLQGITATTMWGKYKEAFFFSTETFTTVGYGRVNPVSDGTNLVAAIEAMSGWLSFALATGLIFGRFARPKAFLLFSDFAVVAPFKGRTALMFRFAPYKDHHTLTDVQIRVNIGFKTIPEGKTEPEYVYYDLNLERTKVESLPLNWTVVHAIDDESPLQGFDQEDMLAADVELYVSIRGFDDVYSNLVQQRTSYTYQEIFFDRKFVPMYRESEDGKTTILELQKLNEYIDLKKS